MFARLLLSTTIAILLGLSTVVLWSSLESNAEDQIARVAEAESYAARSQLVRNTEVLLDALQNVRSYWNSYGHLPRDQWASDAGIELEHFGGVTMLLWDDPGRDIRYLRTDDRPVLDRRPSDEEWARFADLLARSRSATESTLLGPFQGDGVTWLEAVFVDTRDPGSGRLAAIIDTEDAFGRMLMDESPGYAIRIYADDTLMYARDEPAGDVPAEWTREGLIRTSLGTIWRVTHQPTGEMVESFRSPSMDMVLVLGLLVAALIGSLTFESSRAKARARDAELARGEVSELNRGLERQVADRTRELANRTADLQTLTDSVAHDLRNPLNTISVNVQLLEGQFGGAAPAEARVAVQRLHPAVQQMADILDRLFGLSAVTHETFQRERVDMRKLVEETFEDLIVSEPPPPIELVLRELPDTFADATLVEMLVMNLLGNAVKYTRASRPRIIEVGTEDTDAGTAYFVRDNGIGFDSDNADRLFVAFERMNEATSSDGVGLGLTIAMRAVERHGGKIWANGEPGVGATFYFTLVGTTDEGAGPQT